MKSQQLKLFAVLLVPAALAAALWLSGGADYLTLPRLKAHRQVLLAFTRQHYALSSMIFYFLYMTTAFFAPGALVMTIAAGFLFGVAAGTVLVIVASVSGACAAFWLARHFLGNRLQLRYEEQLRWFNREIARHGRYYLIVLRMVPVMPFFMVNYLAGLTRIPLWTLAWTTFFGVLPGSLVYTYAGRQLAKIEAAGDIFSPPLLAGFAVLVLFALIPVAWGHYRLRLKEREFR